MSSPSNRFQTKEAADYARVSPSYFNKLRCHGGGPKYLKIGRRVVYDQADLDAWLNARKYCSTSEYADGGCDD
ncbi:MAG: helix-turn-helix domain-containing protein [Rhizomicrobium sp.]